MLKNFMLFLLFQEAIDRGALSGKPKKFPPRDCVSDAAQYICYMYYHLAGNINTSHRWQ
jgi:hypothetical protein